jgi:hypothetical protein
MLPAMPQYLLHHRHDADQCPIVFAVEAASVEAALGLLPTYLANRTEAAQVGLVQIP